MKVSADATHIKVTNMNNNKESVIPMEDWESVKPMLSDNSIYQYININGEGMVTELGGDDE